MPGLAISSASFADKSHFRVVVTATPTAIQESFGKMKSTPRRGAPQFRLRDTLSLTSSKSCRRMNVEGRWRRVDSPDAAAGEISESPLRFGLVGDLLQRFVGLAASMVAAQ
jgi:hypothetical protein